MLNNVNTLWNAKIAIGYSKGIATTKMRIVYPDWIGHTMLPRTLPIVTTERWVLQCGALSIQAITGVIMLLSH